MRSIKKIALGIFLIGLFGGLGTAAVRAQDIIDWWKLRDYIPSAEIEQLATTTTMTELGKKYFYLHDPVLLDKSSFQDSCTVGEATIVLGCYLSRSRIYLFDVNDERLEGIEEVTAAHEMLHAAYDRLRLDEKETINGLLQEAFARIDDERIRKNVASYQTRDPSVVPNELHSIMGTEVDQLPQQLEEYYSRFFSNRKAIVALAKDYAQEFERREKQIEAYDSQLESINGEIVRLQAELTLQGQALEAERRLLESLRSEPEAFNAGVDGYNAKVRAYNNDVNRVRSLTDEYNLIVQKRNEIAVEERELVEAIDTRAEQL